MTTTYIALLRGINVSGQKLIKMELLRSLFSEMGFQNVRSYIQSGNIAFEEETTDEAVLRAGIEARLASAFGYRVPTILRTRQELEGILLNPPMPHKIDDPAQKYYVTFLEGTPDPQHADALCAMSYGEEEFVCRGRELYVAVEKKVEKAVFTNVLVEKKLKLAGTTRNWNTVNKLAVL